MGVKYAECTLSTHYRSYDEEGNVSGGPMYYIERGLGEKWKPLAVFFAVCAIFGSFGGGNMVKRVDVAVYEAIASAVRGDFEGGVREFGIGDVGVGFVYDDNNRDRIPSPIIERVEGLAAAIARGDIEVPQR